MTDKKCEYCRNTATRYTPTPKSDDPESICEIHYAKFGNSRAMIDPDDVGKCYRCGTKSTNKYGTKERLINHHVNYYLDLTVPICDVCHAEVHNDPESPYYPRGNRMVTGSHIELPELRKE